jgi:hypothetical protein
MIRPLTIVTFLLACGSGLYLYQSKHEVQVLDRTIERAVRDTGALREQSRLLSAEWTMLNDPERLRQFSDTYLNLKSINPAQFTSLADLNTKLPPVQLAPPEPAPAMEPEIPVASQAPQQPRPVEEPDEEPAIVADEVLPLPPVPAPPAPAPRAPAVALVARPAEPKMAVARPPEAQVRPVLAEVRTPEPRAQEQRFTEQHPPEQRPMEQRPSEQRSADQRLASARPSPAVPQQAPVQRPIVLAAPRPVPANVPAYQPPAYQQPAYQPARPAPVGASAPMIASTPAPMPYGGSLLGMARGSMPPAPRPTPVNATYNTN